MEQKSGKKIQPFFFCNFFLRSQFFTALTVVTQPKQAYSKYSTAPHTWNQERHHLRFNESAPSAQQVTAPQQLAAHLDSIIQRLHSHLQYIGLFKYTRPLKHCSNSKKSPRMIQPQFEYPCLTCHVHLFISPANTILPMHNSVHSAYPMHIHTGYHDYRNTQFTTKTQHTYTYNHINMLFTVQCNTKDSSCKYFVLCGCMCHAASMNVLCVLHSPAKVMASACAKGGLPTGKCPPIAGMWRPRSYLITLYTYYHFASTYGTPPERQSSNESMNNVCNIFNNIQINMLWRWFHCTIVNNCNEPLSQLGEGGGEQHVGRFIRK